MWKAATSTRKAQALSFALRGSDHFTTLVARGPGAPLPAAPPKKNYSTKGLAQMCQAGQPLTATRTRYEGIAGLGTFKGTAGGNLTPYVTNRVPPQRN